MGLFNAMWKFSLIYIIVTLIFSLVIVPILIQNNIFAGSDILLLFLAGIFIVSDVFVGSFLFFGLIMDSITTGIVTKGVVKVPINRNSRGKLQFTLPRMGA